MPLADPYSSRPCKSLSTTCTWTEHNPMSLLTADQFDDNIQHEAQRRRELQLTLDKLEGRFTINNEDRYRRGNDKGLSDICGLMSILGEGFDLSEQNQILDGCRLDGGDPTTKPLIDEPQYPDLDDDNFYCQPDVIRGNLIHPAFSGFLDPEDKWETSSRISDDSLFEGHEREQPQWTSALMPWTLPPLSSSPPLRGFGRGGSSLAGGSLTSAKNFYSSTIVTDSWSNQPYMSTRREQEYNTTPKEVLAMSLPPPFHLENRAISTFMTKSKVRPPFRDRIRDGFVKPLRILGFLKRKPQINQCSSTAASYAQLQVTIGVAGGHNE